MTDLRQAQRALDESRFDDAETLCRAILGQAPNHWATYLVLTESLLRRGNLAEADALTSSAFSKNPRQADLLVARGATLARLGRRPEAINLVDQALELRLNNPTAHRLLSTLLAEQEDPSPRYRVTIITPSVGTVYLRQAIESVQAQSYPLLEHVIVSDGPEHHERVAALLPGNPRHPVHMLSLPFNVGGGGFNGHRVYAAVPYLVHSRFVAFLDEDNWFDADHVETLMGPITTQGLSWAYALRKIVDLDGRFIANDDCESLGQWPAWNKSKVHLVDANCYVLRRDLAMSASPLWYRRFRDEAGPDFVLCQKLLKEQPRCTTNGRYTVNYRVGRSAGSALVDYFLQGNRVMQERHGNQFPWRRAPSSQ